jgi:hypothetical protein
LGTTGCGRKHLTCHCSARAPEGKKQNTDFFVHYDVAMNDRQEKNANQIAGEDRRLATLMRAAGAFEALDRRIQPVLPESARGHIRVACVEDDCLVVAADSPAWASRARLQAVSILEAARQIWPDELTRARIIVIEPPGQG